jgi:hypothetical protein
MGFKPERWGLQGEPLPPEPRAEAALWFRIARWEALVTAVVVAGAVVGAAIGLQRVTHGPWESWLPGLGFFGLIVVLGLAVAWVRLLADRRSRRPRPPKNPLEM